MSFSFTISEGTVEQYQVKVFGTLDAPESSKMMQIVLKKGLSAMRGLFSVERLFVWQISNMTFSLDVVVCGVGAWWCGAGSWPFAVLWFVVLGLVWYDEFL